MNHIEQHKLKERRLIHYAFYTTYSTRYIYPRKLYLINSGYKNCLQEVLDESMLRTQADEPDNENMTKKQRETIIQAHMAKYTTKYYESDRRWHSFLPDDSNPRKQKPITKRN